MGKWTKAAEKRRMEIDDAQEKADDLGKLLDAIPPGQRKRLLEDEICGAILRKYGIAE